MRTHIAAFIVAAVLAGSPARADDGAGLAALLSLVPDRAETTHSVPVFGYVDLKAVAVAAGVGFPGSEADFAAMAERDRKAWIEAMVRVSAGPPDVVAYPAGIGRRAVTSGEALGIDWFDIDSAMTFWQPPSTVTAIAGGSGFPDASAVGRALAARGFEQRQAGGFAVWHRLEDYKLALGQKDDAAAGDFLLGVIPRASRVALGDGVVVHATNWPAIEAVAETEAGTAPLSPVATLTRGLLAATASGTGAVLLQANAFMLRDVGVAGDPGGILSQLLDAPSAEAIQKAIAPAEPGPLLPLYPLAFIADMQDGTDQLAVIALPYPDPVSAGAAAAVVAERLASWVPGSGGEPLVEQLDATVEHRVVERDDIAGATFATFIASIEAGDRERQAVAALSDTVGGAAAIVTLRVPMRADSATPVPAGAAFRAILSAIYSRAFTPLAAP